MLKRQTIEELEAVLDKARKKFIKVNPNVEIVETGLYTVAGSRGNSYDVRCGRTDDQQFFVACTCRAGLEGKACYHAAAAFYIHLSIKKLEISKRQKHEMDNAPYLKQGSDKKPETIGKIRI